MDHISIHITAVIEPMLSRAQACTAGGDDEGAGQLYVDILRLDRTHRQALIELGALALAKGRREAARTAFRQAVGCHADDLTSRVTLGNMALEDGDIPAARLHYQSALAVNPECAEACQGMARVLSHLGDETAARPYWAKGFQGHAVVPRQYRGAGHGMDILFLAAARGGNVRLRPWIDDRVLAVTVIYADYYDTAQPLPPHRLVVNAIGDADLNPQALAKAQAMLAACKAPVINPPEQVRRTGRAALARHCEAIEGSRLPDVRILPRADIPAAPNLQFPVLLRTPGFHTGQHFALVETEESLAEAVERLPGDELFIIEYLNARGADGMFRKYRVMFIDGVLYPWHLAISNDWKVHYYTAGMADNAIYREEERLFLKDMQAVLGLRAMAALEDLNKRLGLDFAGADFALSQDGSILLFEANATMTINSPPAGGIWDYRRSATADVQNATRKMLLRRAGVSQFIN